jgi:hypothetical protein
LLIVAFIFIPAVSVASRPVGYIFLSLAGACSALCVVLAWANWKKFAKLSIPSIAVQAARPR